MSISLFTKIPPTISTTIFYIILVVTVVYRLLLGTILGVFVLSLSLWWLSPYIFNVEPFSTYELINYLSTLERDYKIAAISSILTITGFIIAFYVATINWKQQMNAQLKYSAATEIENFFSEATSLITNARIFSESVVETVNEIQKKSITDETVFKVRYVLEQSQQFISIRNRLSEQSVEVHRLVGKHYSLLATGWGTLKGLNGVVDAFTEITKTMWVHVPIVMRDDPDLIAKFLAQVNIEEYLSFIQSCETHYDYINGVTGGVRGQLTSQIVGFNLASFIHLLSSRREFRDAMTAIYKKNGNG